MRNCKSALHLKHHRLGILQQLTEVLQPRSTDGTVHQPVVTAQRGRHLINDTESEKTKSPRHFYKTLATNSSTILIIPLLVILIGNELLLCCAHCQYTRLRRVDDGAELRNSCKTTFQLEKITITVPHKQKPPLTEHSQIRDGNCAALELMRLQFAIPGLQRKRLDLLRNIHQPLAIRTKHNRGD